MSEPDKERATIRAVVEETVRFMDRIHGNASEKAVEHFRREVHEYMEHASTYGRGLTIDRDDFDTYVDALIETLAEAAAGTPVPSVELDDWRELADAAEGVTQYVRVGNGPLGSDPAAVAMRRLFDALGAVRLARSAGQEEEQGG